MQEKVSLFMDNHLCKQPFVKKQSFIKLTIRQVLQETTNHLILNVSIRRIAYNGISIVIFQCFQIAVASNSDTGYE
jgi:hypothetical protein